MSEETPTGTTTTVAATATVGEVSVFYNLLDGGPIACPYCFYITRPSITYCPQCGCPMRLRGDEIRYPGIEADYKASRKDPDVVL